MDIFELYNSNDDFKVYVDKYCNQNKVTVEDALTHQMVINYALAILSK